MNWIGKVLGKEDDSNLDYSPEERKIFVSSFRIGWTVIVFGVAGLATIALWAWGIRGGTANVHVAAFIGADLLVAGAAASAGALFGFVFGIPRTLDPASRAAVATATSQGGSGAASTALMSSNTNLERISDWLTTLLIGATLVQIKEIAGWVGALGKGLFEGGKAANEAVIPVIVIYFFALAFLGVYLITRLYLTSAFLQTLGMLTGNAEIADPKDLAGAIDAALASGKFSDLQAALKAYDQSNLPEADRANPQLNEKLARLAAKAMASGSKTGRSGDPIAELKAFTIRAAADPAVRTSLRNDIVSHAFATGNGNLDNELGNILK
jgi:hypothetical protein